MPDERPDSENVDTPDPQPAGEPQPVLDPGMAASLPKELGVMLVSAGVIGVVLPGPGAPALVAGGLILWPEAGGRVERWFQRRFPEAHRQGMGHVNRFLADLERRYPGSTRPGSSRAPDDPDRR
jgi:hypothetical protein